MEDLDRKRSRLRQELRTASSAWLTASALYPSPERSGKQSDACHDASARMKWVVHIAARNRMVLAYAGTARGI